MADDSDFMRMAIEEALAAQAENEVPIGAVIVKDGNIIARAHNQVEQKKQGTAHAELLAIQKASQLLGDWRLDNCDLYVTKEPCPMCAGAMVNCRIRRVIFGCSETRTGLAGSALPLLQIPNALHSVELTQGVLQDECKSILQDFFRRRRNEQR